MRVAVCCKGVPIDATIETVQISEGDIQFKGTDFYINEFDAYALEAAMVLKKTHSAETFALSLGPLRVQDVLYHARARGIDQVFRIDGETNHPELVAHGLIPTLKEIEPQLILAGVQSEDWMGGEVGVYLSQALNMGFAYAVTEICELNDEQARIKKELGGGKFAEVVLKLPAVLCVQSGIYPLNYVSRSKKLQAAKLPIKLGPGLDKEIAGESISGMMGFEVREVAPPPTEGHAEMISGERSEQAVKVLEIIENAV